jgi:hypothetical protein
VIEGLQPDADIGVVDGHGLYSPLTSVTSRLW